MYIYDLSGFDKEMGMDTPEVTDFITEALEFFGLHYQTTDKLSRCTRGITDNMLWY